MHLTAIERRWLCSIFATILPTAEVNLFPAPSEVPMERFLEDFNRSAPAEVTLGLRVALWIVMLAPPFLLGKLRTFTGLSVEERLVVLQRLAASDVYLLRELPLLLKTIGCLGYCGVPEVQSRLGIPSSNPTPPAWLSTRAHPVPMKAGRSVSARTDQQ